MKTLFRTILLAGALAAGMNAVATLPARALVEIDVNKGNVEPLPVAVTDFLSSDGLGAEITSIISADLKRSGLFAPIDKGAFIEKISNPDAAPALRGLEGHQCAGAGDRPRHAGGRWTAEGRIPAVGHLCRRAAGRRAVFRKQGEFAPRRPHYR